MLSQLSAAMNRELVRRKEVLLLKCNLDCSDEGERLIAVWPLRPSTSA